MGLMFFFWISLLLKNVLISGIFGVIGLKLVLSIVNFGFIILWLNLNVDVVKVLRILGCILVYL